MEYYFNILLTETADLPFVNRNTVYNNGSVTFLYVVIAMLVM